MYYVDVHMHNNQNFDVLMHWFEMEKDMNESIPAGGSVVHSALLKSTKQPQNSVYTAYNPTTMAIVKLNGKDHVSITPTIQHNWVTITTGDKQGIVI